MVKWNPQTANFMSDREKNTTQGNCLIQGLFQDHWKQWKTIKLVLDQVLGFPPRYKTSSVSQKVAN